MDHRSTLSNNLSCNQMAQFNQESIRLCVAHYMDITAGYPTRNRQRERRPLSCRREVHRWARTGFLLRHMHTLSYGGTVVWNLLAVSSSTGSLNVLVVTCSPCVRRASRPFRGRVSVRRAWIAGSRLRECREVWAELGCPAID